MKARSETHDDDRSDAASPNMDVDASADGSRTVFMSSPIPQVEVVSATHVAPSSASDAMSVAQPVASAPIEEVHGDDFISAPAEDEHGDYGYGFSF